MLKSKITYLKIFKFSYSLFRKVVNEHIADIGRAFCLNHFKNYIIFGEINSVSRLMSNSAVIGEFIADKSICRVVFIKKVYNLKEDMSSVNN